MRRKRFADIWHAIEETPAQAENMKLRSVLMMALKDHIARAALGGEEVSACMSSVERDDPGRRFGFRPISFWRAWCEALKRAARGQIPSYL
jgi:hypothetical protein